MSSVSKKIQIYFLFQFLSADLGPWQWDRLQWLLMRTSPIVDFHNEWLNGGFHISKVWFILFYIYIWQVISSNRNGPHMRCLTVMDPWLSSALDMRSSYEEHLMVVTKIETKCQATKLSFISLQIIVNVIFVCNPSLLSWFVGRGRWHSRSKVNPGWGLYF